MAINFIKNIFEKKITPRTHQAFIRYSLGEFEKETFTITKSKGIKVSAGFEYLNFMQEFLSGLVKQKATLSGLIETVNNLEQPLQSLSLAFNPAKRFGKSGAKYVFDSQEISVATYKKIVDNFFGEYLLLSVQSPEGEIKVKSKNTPKIGSSTEGFVTLLLPLTSEKLFHEEFLFDINKDFKKAVIKHTYFVDDIKVDEKLFKTNPDKARKEAKRKIRIKRVVELDGQKYAESTVASEV
ncbi:hypothetical protein J4417_00665 [Candidatus Woesearchaeota archaeon]|nr:hypothetical protein [Candidatus Woesearchaeota archaeon]